MYSRFKKLSRFLYDLDNRFTDWLGDLVVRFALWYLMSHEPYICFYDNIGME